MADYEDKDREGEGRPKVEVIIEDLRHRRGDDAETDETESDAPVSSGRPADPPARPETPPAAPAAEPAAPAAEPTATAETAPVIASSAGDSLPGDTGAVEQFYDDYAGEDDLPGGEMEQIRALFSAGLVNYLRGQLGLLLNFALLGMGRAADPGTGLVSKNLPQAKVAIDVLEFIVARIEGELAAEERTQMKALVSDLKYAFMQAASDTVPPTVAEG